MNEKGRKNKLFTCVRMLTVMKVTHFGEFEQSVVVYVCNSNASIIDISIIDIVTYAFIFVLIITVTT